MLTKSLCIASKSGSRLRVKYKHGVIRGAATTTLSWEPFSARLWPHQANPQRRCLNSRETSHAATVSRAATKKSRDREGSTPIGSTPHSCAHARPERPAAHAGQKWISRISWSSRARQQSCRTRAQNTWSPQYTQGPRGINWPPRALEFQQRSCGSGAAIYGAPRRSKAAGAKYTENAKNARPKGGKTAVGCRCLMREAIRPQNKNIACRCILALSPKRCPLRNAS